MTHENILALLDGVLARLTASDVRLLSLEAEGVSLHIERGVSAPSGARPAAPDASVVYVAPPLALTENTPAPAASPAGSVIPVKSPIVGTFYAAPAPDAPPYVTVGSRVSKGDTLCVLEAMKMMNEIEAERDGVITRVLMQSGDLAEYGQVLFEMEAAE